MLRRRGAVAIVAMIGVLVAGMITATLVRLAITRYRQVEREALRLQAHWLAEAGIERAAMQLARDSGYRGETWDVTAGDLGGERGSRVTITVGPLDQQENADAQLSISAVADYPTARAATARVRKTVTFGTAR